MIVKTLVFSVSIQTPLDSEIMLPLRSVKLCEAEVGAVVETGTLMLLPLESVSETLVPYPVIVYPSAVADGGVGGSQPLGGHEEPPGEFINSLESENEWLVPVKSWYT